MAQLDQLSAIWGAGMCRVITGKLDYARVCLDERRYLMVVSDTLSDDDRHAAACEAFALAGQEQPAGGPAICLCGLEADIPEGAAQPVYRLTSRKRIWNAALACSVTAAYFATHVLAGVDHWHWWRLHAYAARPGMTRWALIHSMTSDGMYLTCLPIL